MIAAIDQRVVVEKILAPVQRNTAANPYPLTTGCYCWIVDPRAVRRREPTPDAKTILPESPRSKKTDLFQFDLRTVFLSDAKNE